MNSTTARQAVAEVQERQYERQRAYEQWERQQVSDPRFASVRFLVDDIRDHDEILPETWERFDVEERTWGAEVLNAPHSHIDRFVFDGQDIVVKESDGMNPRVTLRDVYSNGLEKTRRDVEDEPGLAFQLRRDELFMEFYQDIERMMRGQTDYDTICMISTCPIPSELSDDPKEAEHLMKLRWYDDQRRKSFDYTARRLPNGQLELSATTLDGSDLAAHARVLEEHGHEDVGFAMLPSHEYGAYRSYDNTTEEPIELIIADRVGIYDQELTMRTGRPHRFGREDDTGDAHEFFRSYCEDYWAGYKAYHELLAQHLAGGELQRPLQKYLLKCLESQERVGQSVLDQDKLTRLRTQLWQGKVTMDMAMSCRELLVYDHHATLTRLLKQYKETGQVDQLVFADEGGFMDAYADAASDNGSAAAANGETFAGCETATSVSGLAGAAQAAARSGVSLEQMLRIQNEEAMHCLNIQLYGFTIRRNVTCPFCTKQVDARDTERIIECLNIECGTILDKATGNTSVRQTLLSPGGEQGETGMATVARLRSGESYELGGYVYRREQRIVVGGAVVYYTDPAGQVIEGVHAQRLDAIISQQISAETQAV
jgi:hypothetical protein